MHALAGFMVTVFSAAAESGQTCIALYYVPFILALKGGDIFKSTTIREIVTAATIVECLSG